MTRWWSRFLVLVSVLWAQAASAEETTHAAADSGTPHLPSIAEMLVHWLGPQYEWIEHWVNILFAAATSLIFVVVALIVYRRRQLIPGPFQNFIEMLVEGMYNFIHSILGEDAKTYTPYLGTLFFYVLMNNYWGVIPLGHSPSTSINITASLALMTFLIAEYTGVRRLGIAGYFDHLLGQPRSAVTWAVAPLMFFVELIGKVAKPFSLAVRLFCNITGEDVLVAAFVMLGLATLSFIHSPIGLPLNVPFIALGLLLSTIQALVFTLLSTIYILLMLPHDEHH